MSQFSEPDICAMTEDIWLSMLNLPASQIDPDAAGDGTGRTITGIVNIAGDWRGAVVLQLPYDLAALVATTMLNLGDVEPTIEDIQDSVGEMANMTGGGIKSLIPGVSHLSLPTVVEGRNFSVRFPGMEITDRIAFQQDAWSFMISIATAVRVPMPVAR